MYQELCNKSSDINENLPVLARLASECTSVCEMGVRYIVSTWAFVEGLKKGGKLLSIDIKHPSSYGGDITLIESACKDKGIDFEFKEISTLDVKIPKIDLLFIDTDHTYTQLSQELKLHADKSQKYIVFHDTVSCADELIPAINELVEQGKWKVKEHYTNNNGMLVLERV